MTIVCALHQDGETWMGCDGLTIAGDHHIASFDSKKFVVGKNVAIGSSSARRANHLLNEQLEAFDKTGQSILQISNSLRQMLVEDDFANAAKSDVGPPNYGETFIVVTREPRSIFEVFSRFEITPVDDRIAAIGCGDDYAMGAWLPMQRWGKLEAFSLLREPKVQLTMAIEAACHFSSHCGGEIRIERLWPDKEASHDSE